VAGVAKLMFSFRVPRWLIAVLRIVVAAIFIYAGITKAVAPLRFVSDIDNFRILPWIVTPPLAVYLPWLEIVCGLALLFVRFDQGALLILLLLTLVFIGALTSAQIRKLDISCGCFGHSTPALNFTSHLALDFVIIAVLLLLLLSPMARRQQA
jgi:putative oxidoreductase